MIHTEAYVAKLRREHELKTTLLNTMEAASMIGCHVADVYRLIKSGDLESVPSNGRIKGTMLTAWTVEVYLARQQLREKILRNTSIRPDALAELLCCSRSTIYRLIKDGHFDLAPARPNRPKTTTVTAWSVEKYINSITRRRTIAA